VGAGWGQAWKGIRLTLCYVAYAEPPELTDPALLEALRQFQRAIDDLVQALAELVFIQLGNFPMHRTSKATPITPEWWTLTGFRSVQYVQTDKQKETQARLNKTRAENARQAATKDCGASRG
jgi:hypothetical protein